MSIVINIIPKHLNSAGQINFLSSWIWCNEETRQRTISSLLKCEAMQFGR